MPKVKKDCKYTKTYDEEKLQKALNEIQSGSPKKQASIKYGIPRQTLQYRLGEKFKKGFRACGLYPWNADNIDFSKCLGKIHPNSETEPPKSHMKIINNLTYETFTQIVGDKKLNKLKEGKANSNENLCLLLKISQHFNNVEISNTTNIYENDVNESIILIENRNTETSDKEHYTEKELNDMPIVLNDDNGQRNDIQLEISQRNDNENLLIRSW
ncbi:hypothetical protein ILUMI_02052 [Ignelater luminosus]|uniref:HTH psq-type domain-containing protein n=1 Tax=Ignelater luminosus TaxID=2038154 RepID=A0A8K0GJM5_IGNLU|nr:hypothetical protein ILUMI_02052 [Ignelater luminosus]